MSGVQIHEEAVPRPAALVRDFVNTLDHELGTDALDSPDGLAAFLVAQGLAAEPSAVAGPDLAAAVRLRSALHDALELNHAGAREALPDLDEVLGTLPVRLAWDGGSVVATPARDGVDGALARIGLAAHDSVAAEVWWRLKICAFDECEWAYYDHSKNRSRAYCEYGCGNKLKTRAYRARQKAAGPASPNTG